MNIPAETMKQFDELQQDLQLYIGDYSAFNLEKTDWGWEDWDEDNGVWKVTANIHSDFIKETLYLFFKISKTDRKILCGFENENEEMIEGETLWRELFFNLTK